MDSNENITRVTRLEAKVDVLIDQASELRRDMRNLNTHMMTHHSEFKEFIGAVNQRFENYDKNITSFHERANQEDIPGRVRRLEQAMERIKPIVAAMTALIAAVVTGIGKWLGL